MFCLDPEKLYQLISGEVLSEEQIREKRLENLYWTIVEEWSEASDVDYSIPLQDILDMVEKSPEFFAVRMGAGEISETMCCNLLDVRSACSKRRRVL